MKGCMDVEMLKEVYKDRLKRTFSNLLTLLKSDRRNDSYLKLGIYRINLHFDNKKSIIKKHFFKPILKRYKKDYK